MSQYKIKNNGITFAQTSPSSVAAFLALSYKADVNYNNRKIVWSHEVDSALIAGKDFDEALKIVDGAISIRSTQFQKESDARFEKKMAKFREEREQLMKENNIIELNRKGA
jgi:hypothetical protein